MGQVSAKLCDFLRFSAKVCGFLRFCENLRLPNQWARRDILMSRDKIAARQLLSLNCLVITLTAGVILKEEKMPSLVSEPQERVWEAILETIWARVITSQKLSRDSGETIFAARHQDVSQGPLETAVNSRKSSRNSA